MDLAIGSIYEGKVTGITKFGAFVSLPEGKSGMVHISEIANSYVSNISDFLQEGQQVTVKIINIDSEGRINLSIKKALPQTETQPSAPRGQGGFVPRPMMADRRPPRPRNAGGPRGAKQPIDPASLTFEDRLKMFMQDSESRLSDIKHNTDRKSGARRKK